MQLCQKVVLHYNFCCQRGLWGKSKYLLELQSQWDLVCALYPHQLIWQQLLEVSHWCWFHGRKWPFLATQGKMFVLRRAIESLFLSLSLSLSISPSPSCSLASALKVTVCTHRHWLSLHFSLSFSLFLFPPLPSPISLWPSVIYFKNAFEKRRKKTEEREKGGEKRNIIRQKKGNEDRKAFLL